MAGFSPDQSATMTAVALAESGGNSGAHNPHGEDSRGLWQINAAAHPNLRGVDLYDPVENAKAAFRVSRSGADVSPWTTTHGGGRASTSPTGWTPRRRPAARATARTWASGPARPGTARRSGRRWRWRRRHGWHRGSARRRVRRPAGRGRLDGGRPVRPRRARPGRRPLRVRRRGRGRRREPHRLRLQRAHAVGRAPGRGRPARRLVAAVPGAGEAGRLDVRRAGPQDQGRAAVLLLRASYGRGPAEPGARGDQPGRRPHHRGAQHQGRRGDLQRRHRPVQLRGRDPAVRRRGRCGRPARGTAADHAVTPTLPTSPGPAVDTDRDGTRPTGAS